jgi:hypothetical protein
MARLYLIFGDIEGKLEQMNLEFTAAVEPHFARAARAP